MDHSGRMNSNGTNVQHALASSRLTPVEWADLIVKTSVVDVSRRPLRQHSSEVDSVSEAMPRRVLTAQLTVDKRRAIIIIIIIEIVHKVQN